MKMSSNGNCELFLTGSWLRERIAELDRRVRSSTDDLVRMEEYIALPYFGGQIIVRFTACGPLTMEDADELERKLQNLVGEEFLVDFMGDVYRRLGVDYSRLDQIAERLGQRFKDEPLYGGPYAEHIEEDARTLLLRCDLPQTVPIWEIQWEDGEFALLLMGDKNRNLRTVESQPPIHVMEVDGALCEGFMRAIFGAKRMGISLGRLMLEAMEG